MKKALLLIGILVAANILVAQDSRTAKEKADVRVERFKERLELTSEQKEQLKEMREKYRPELKAIIEDHSKSRSDKLRAVADIHDLRQQDLSGILSVSQMQELKNIQTQVRENMRKKRRMRMRIRSGR